MRRNVPQARPGSPVAGSHRLGLLTEGLDPSAGVAKHVQLQGILRRFVEAHAGAGELIPSERELCGHFGVARMTVRQAVDALVADGVLERVVGLGTFVARSKVDLQVKLTSYSEEMHRRGMVPDAHVLSFEQVGASQLVARELQIEPGQPVVRFRRQLLADGEPMSVDENFIPAHYVPGFVDEDPPVSLYNVLSDKYGLMMEWGEDTIEATAASASIARLLDVELGAPVLKIQRHAYVARAMVDYSVSYYRADRYKLWVPLQRPGVRTPRSYHPVRHQSA